jgi:hypothetical protein
MEARHIIAGVLGCPVCGEEYPIAGGVLQLGVAIGAGSSHDLGTDAAVRAAALLNLTTPSGIVLLAGAWARHAVDVAALAEGVQVIALDAPDEAPPAGMGVSRVDAGARLPLGAGLARGIALDAGHATAETLRQAADALGAGGRLVAPVSAPIPVPLIELARDDRWWVAEHPVATPVVPLTTARRS